MTQDKQIFNHLNGSIRNSFDRVSITPSRSRICRDNPDALEFLDWFEGSVVCDKRGYPLVQYHGSHADIGDTHFLPYSHFGIRNVGNGFTGFNRHDPNQVAERRGGVVYPVILNIKKPLGLPDIDIHTTWNIIDRLHEWDIISEEEKNWINAARKIQEKHPICMNEKHAAYIKNEYPSQLFAHYKLTDCSTDFWTSERLTEVLKQKGYDGIGYINTHEYAGSVSWIVFEPEKQIRFATDANKCSVPLSYNSNYTLHNTDEKTYPKIQEFINEMK